jgi:hypothetical protein
VDNRNPSKAGGSFDAQNSRPSYPQEQWSSECVTNVGCQIRTRSCTYCAVKGPRPSRHCLIQHLGPWTGSKEGDIDRLRLPLRLLLAEQHSILRQQGAQSLHLNRLSVVRHINESFGDHIRVIPGRENERHAARPERVGHREDHVAAHLDIEHCAIEVAAMLYQIERPLNGVC